VHGGGVDVAHFADALVDQRGAQRVDGHEFLAHEEAGQVEVVDRHVAEQAARALDVGRRRRGGVAADDGDDLEVADIAAADAPLEFGEVGVEAAVEADHQRRLVLLHHLEGLLDGADVERHRLFAHDRLAGVGGCLDLLGMEAGGRADQDGIDVLRCHDLVDAGDLGAVFLSQCLGCGGHGVGDIGHLRLGA